jgi:hypothetical protein
MAYLFSKKSGEQKTYFNPKITSSDVDGHIFIWGVGQPLTGQISLHTFVLKPYR